MTHIPPRQMMAFVDELSKEAGPMDFLREQVAGRYGRQMLLGAGLGGGLNVLRHHLADPKVDAQGGILDPTIAAAKKSNRLKQFVRGAAVGGGLAGGRILATGAGRQSAKKAIKDFYDKERYGLTGKGLGDTSESQLARAQELGLVGKAPVHGIGPMTRAGDEAFSRAQAQHNTSVGAFQKGYSSLPGVLHGLVTNPLDVLRDKKGIIGKAALTGGLVGAASNVLTGPSREEGGPGTLRSAVGGAASGAVGALAPATMLAGGLFKSLPGQLAHKAQSTASSIRDAGRWAMHDTPPGRVVPPAEAQPQMTEAPAGYYGG